LTSDDGSRDCFDIDVQAVPIKSHTKDIQCPFCKEIWHGNSLGANEINADGECTLPIYERVLDAETGFATFEDVSISIGAAHQCTCGAWFWEGMDNE